MLKLTVAGANVGLVQGNQLLGQLVQLLKVVARVGDLVRLETQPAHHVENSREILLLLLLWVGVIVS